MPPIRTALARFSPWLTLVAVYVALGLAGRTLLWARFGIEADVAASRLPYILTAGFINDLIESLYLFAPFALYILLVPDRWFRSTANRVVLYTATAAAVAGLIYLTAAEYFFFEEFDARFNIVAYDYLAYPTEVFTDIWDAYPVMKVLAVAVTLAALAVFFLRHSLQPGFDHVVRFRERLVTFAPYAVVLALAVAFYPTNALSLSSNRVENELVQNGHSSFFRAARTSDIDYESYYASGKPADNLRLLREELAADGAPFTQLALGKVNRLHPARPDGLGRLNVVVVASESFGAEFSRALVRQHVRLGHAHRARPRSHHRLVPADSDRLDPAPARQPGHRQLGQGHGRPRLPEQLPLRRLRLLRRHEHVLRGERLPGARPHGHRQGPLRERLGRCG
jgi:phosphoglycerol transferase MdoB-like AlkP superfamily enzyme